MFRGAIITALAMAASVAVAARATAQEFYLGQVITMATTYCPQGTLPADGRPMPINQFQALYSLLGTTYGGDGTTAFNLPDLRGRSVLLGRGSDVNTTGSPLSTFQPLGKKPGDTTSIPEGTVLNLNGSIASGLLTTAEFNAVISAQTITSTGSITLVTNNLPDLPADYYALYGSNTLNTGNQPGNAGLGAVPVGGKFYLPNAQQSDLSQKLAVASIRPSSATPRTPTAIDVSVTNSGSNVLHIQANGVTASIAGSVTGTTSMATSIGTIATPTLSMMQCIVTTAGYYPPRPN